MLEKYLSVRILIIAAVMAGIALVSAAAAAGFGEYCTGLVVGVAVGAMYFVLIIRQTVRLPGMTADEAERHAQAGFALRFVMFVALLSLTLYLPGVKFPGVVVGFLIYQGIIILYGFHKLV